MSSLFSRRFLSLSLLAVLAPVGNAEELYATNTDPELQQPPPAASYGVDCSFPIHSDYEANSCGDLLGDRQKFYEDLIAGCRAKYAYRCDQTEEDRILQLRHQPQSLLNYTTHGFAKIRAPERLFRILKNHWERNKDKQGYEENWPKGHTYVNHWEHKTTYYNLGEPELGGGLDLAELVSDLAQPIIEEWTGQELRPTSLYGIRVYHKGSILAPHVDRNPLISSAIVNVASDPDMEEDWPLEVYDRDGKAVNISMSPGDMVLYESGTVIHGRPFPLKGKYYANTFIHFEPTGRTLEDVDEEDNYYDSPENPAAYEGDVRLPPYMIPGSEAATRYSISNPWGWELDGSQFEEEFDDSEEDDEDSEDEDEDESMEEESMIERKEAAHDSSSPSCLSNTDPALAPAECQSELESSMKTATA